MLNGSTTDNNKIPLSWVGLVDVLMIEIPNENIETKQVNRL